MAEEKSSIAVQFLSVSDSYSPSKSLSVGFKCPSGMSVSTSDWIGIFKVGWVSTRDYYTFEWVNWSSPVEEDDQKVGSVTFAGRRIPPSDGNMYQFCYVGRDYSMRGCSRPFMISSGADDISFIDSEFVEITSDDIDQLRSMVVINTVGTDKKGGVPAILLELKETVQRLGDEKGEIIKELAASKEKASMLDEELVEKQKAFDYIQQNSEEIVKEAEQKQAMLDDMAVKLVEAEQLLASLEAKVSQFGEENSGLKLEVGKLLADVESIREELQVCQTEKAGLVASKMSLEKEIKYIKETTVSREAFEALQQAQKSLQSNLTEGPLSSIAVISEKEMLEARNDELVTKLNMCKDEYTQKCYEVRNLQKQLAAMNMSGDTSTGSDDAIDSVMQELESRREKCRELEEKNAKFEEQNMSLEERVVVAMQHSEELKEEKLNLEEKLDSMVKERDEQISLLTQEVLQLNEELASIREGNASKVQQMTNAVQSLTAQLASKEEEISALKVQTRQPPPQQNLYGQHPSTRGQQPSAHGQHPSTRGQPVYPPLQKPPPQHQPAPAPKKKECPMCRLKFPASTSDNEFEAHVQSHFDY